MAPKKKTISALGLLPLAAWASAAAAQQQTNTIGDPQLKDFQLPGTRTTPPAPTPTPAPAATSTPTPSPAAPQPPAAAPAPARPTPAAEPRPRAAETPRPAAPRPTAETPAVAPPTAPPLPSPEMVEEALPGPDPVPLPAPPTQAAPVPLPAPAPAPAPTSAPAAAAEPEGNWLNYAGAAGALLAALAAFLFLRRRRRDREEEVFTEEAAPAPEPALKPAPRPAPPVAAAPPPQPVRPASPPAPPVAPEPAPAAGGGVVGIQLRPWIELEFRPARAAATETEANVQFDLIVRNKGNAAARDIRIEVRMFNAGPDQEREIESFYAEPIRGRTRPALPGLHPRGEVTLTSAVALPKEQVREIELQGRRLFIPTVAFNIVYDWGNGRSGQTSASYLVGREAETPSAKMGAFRLDLGPRLYRSVGQRPTRLARAL